MTITPGWRFIWFCRYGELRHDQHQGNNAQRRPSRGSLPSARRRRPAFSTAREMRRD
jgi:hypothetical protein